MIVELWGNTFINIGTILGVQVRSVRGVIWLVAIELGNTACPLAAFRSEQLAGEFLTKFRELLSSGAKYMDAVDYVMAPTAEDVQAYLDAGGK